MMKLLRTRLCFEMRVAALMTITITFGNNWHERPWTGWARVTESGPVG